MTGKLNFLSNVHNIPCCFIRLPNRSHTIANFEGTVKLGSELVIHNVLYVLDVMYNLISISQLLHSNPEYGVYFFKIFCVIHDHMLRKEIELGRLAHGVYNFS